MNNNTSYEKLSSLKSERTTFNLSNEAYDLLDKLSNSYEITQKETLSLIMGDDALLFNAIKKIRDNSVKISEDKSSKTKVISKGALEKLNELVRHEGFSRDLLLEATLKELKNQLNHRIESHKDAATFIQESINHQIETEKKLREILHDNDPILMRWELIIDITSILKDAINNEIEKGTPIDPEDFSQNM